MVTLWQLDRRRDALLDIVDDAPQVAPRDVALHHNPALHVFAHDEVRAAIALDRRNRRQRHLRAIGGFDHRRSDGIEIGRALVARVANHQRERHLPLEHLTDDLAGPRGLQRLRGFS